MTFPISVPSTVGGQPPDAATVNRLIGQHLSEFARVKSVINQDQAYLAATDLKTEPYFFTPDQETLIKSAISGLDTSLDNVDMTFISRLIGLPNA